MADTDNTAARSDTEAAVDPATPEAPPKAARKRTTGSRTRRVTRGTGTQAKAKDGVKKKTSTTKTGAKPANKKGAGRKASTSGGKAKDGAKKKAPTKTKAKPANAKAPARKSAAVDTGQPVVRKPTKAQNRKNLQAKLEQVRSELVNLRSTFEGEVDIDPEEGDVEVAERTKNISLIQMLETRERQFLDALQSVESGEYGKCKRCREDIHPERLQVVPDAKYCIRCQELVERAPARLF